MTHPSKEQILFLKKRKHEKILITVCRILIFVLFLSLWEISATKGWIDSFIFCSPGIITQTFCDMCKDQSLFTHIGITLWETIRQFFPGGRPGAWHCGRSMDFSETLQNSGTLSRGSEQSSKVRAGSPSDRMAWRQSENHHRGRDLRGDLRFHHQPLHWFSRSRQRQTETDRNPARHKTGCPVQGDPAIFRSADFQRHESKRRPVPGGSHHRRIHRCQTGTWLSDHLWKPGLQTFLGSDVHRHPVRHRHGAVQSDQSGRKAVPLKESLTSVEN